jgi:hypothetical protein
VYELAEARAGFAPPAVPPARAVLGQEAGPLQGGLDVDVGQGDAVLTPRALMKMTRIEPGVAGASGESGGANSPALTSLVPFYTMVPSRKGALHG